MNTALRFPSPGQRLTADFGRQLARNINSLRITGGPGVRVTQGPNGVTISAASQGGGGSSSASGDYFPFRLSAYMDADSGKHYAVVMTNDGSVQILPSGTGHRLATAENAEATMAVENGWRLVAGAFSCAKDAKTEAVTTTVTDLATLEDYAWDKDDPRFDVYAVIYRTADEAYSFVVTDTLEQPGAVDPLGEDAFVACVYVGTFQRTYDEDTEQYSYGVSNQVLRSALVLREEADEEELYPFKMKRVNEGTEDAPDWKTVVYLPADAVQADGWAKFAVRSATNAAVEGMEGWYYVDDTADANEETNGLKVYLHVHAYFWVVDSGKVAGGSGDGIKTSALYCAYLVSRSPTASVSETVTATGDLALGEKKTLDEKIAIGTFDETTNDAENWVRSAFNVSKMFQSLAYEDWWTRNVWAGGGSGGGTTVAVQSDESTVAYFVSTAAEKDGVVTITTGSSLASSAVSIGDESGTDLDVYLKGGAAGFGTNVNTENFAEQCLGGSSGKATTAARSDHTHDEIENLEASVKEFSSAEWLLERLGYTDEDGKPLKDEDGNLLSVQDAIGGTVSTDVKSAINSALNDTDAEGNVTSKFASADHSHGNIDKDGKITGAAGGLLVTIGDDGTIGEAATIVPTDLASTFDDDVGYLSAVLGTFDYDSAKSQFTLSTDKLKYKDAGTGTHSGDCLLKVDKDGYVLHDGNTSYNALYDLATNHFDLTSSANDGKGEIALKYTALALKKNETLDANATKAVVFKGSSLASTAGKAELADVAVLAPKTGEDGASADYAPKSDAVPAEGEDDAAKIARVGTSGYAARADHVHIVDTDMTNAADAEATHVETISLPTGVTLSTSTWTPGLNGYKERYCSRVVANGNYRYLFFRTRSISKTGQIVSIGAEDKWVRCRYA